MFTTHIESFLENVAELEPLFKMHADEISQHLKHGIELNPCYNQYAVKENLGGLLFIALRSNGRLVGYFNGFIGRALHYDCIQLSLDLFYVEPEYRGMNCGQRGGVLLMLKAKEEAIRRGVKIWTMGHKVARGKHMQKLLLDCGFEPFEMHYALWL